MLYDSLIKLLEFELRNFNKNQGDCMCAAVLHDHVDLGPEFAEAMGILRGLQLRMVLHIVLWSQIA